MHFTKHVLAVSYGSHNKDSHVPSSITLSHVSNSIKLSHVSNSITLSHVPHSTNIKRSVFLMETDRVFCAEQTEFLYEMWMHVSLQTFNRNYIDVSH